MLQLPGLKMIEKGNFPEAGEVDKLIREYEVSAVNFTPQASTGSGSNDVCATQVVDSPDIGPVINFRWRKLV